MKLELFSFRMTEHRRYLKNNCSREKNVKY